MVQIVAAEDTRRTRVLLDHLDLRVPELLSLHGHNEHVVSERLLERLLGGSDVALVSDAGNAPAKRSGLPACASCSCRGRACRTRTRGERAHSGPVRVSRYLVRRFDL